MATVSETFVLAFQHHHAGAYALAEQLYRQVLQADANHADAHHMLGVLAMQLGRSDLAIASIERAIALAPWAAPYHVNLGLAHQALGHMAAAVAAFQTALRLNPDFAEAHYASCYALLTQGLLEEAVAHGKEALRIRPIYPEARNSLGNAYFLQNKMDAAAAEFNEALRTRPSYPEPHNSLGNILFLQDKMEDAVAHFNEALRLRPNYGLAYANLGNVLNSQGQFEEALACTEQALRHEPQCALAHRNRSVLWLIQGDFERGWPEYEWRWTLPRLDRAESLAAGAGASPEGHPDFVRRSFREPMWDGGPLHGRPILLHCEQGLGDTLQFIRYANLVKNRGGRVIVECQPPLLRLLAGAPGIDQLVARGDNLPAFDVQAALLSLPGLFRTSLETIPAPVPYLHADAALEQNWRERLAATVSDSEAFGSSGDLPFRVGIAWQGNSAYRDDRKRSIPLTYFTRLAQVEGIQLISLQHGPGTEQLSALGLRQSALGQSDRNFSGRQPTADSRQPMADGRWPVLDFDRLDESAGPFMDTAAIMKNLDLVISSDTAISHLAGALSIPVWVALPLVPDWRWLLKREDSPWYPTMRLFRQSKNAHWDDVFERMAAALEMLAAKRIR